MEAWRNELYNSFSHSVEGSTWKDHKYVAIVNGKYIYPEDLKEDTTATSSNPNKKSYALDLSEKQSGKAKETASKIASSEIKIKDKGRILNKNYLPKEPDIGDMYYLEDTKQKVYWDGESWALYNGKKKGGSGSGGGSVGNYGLKPETISRIRSILNGGSSKAINVRGFGGGR